MTDTGKIKIHNKEYLTVAYRVSQFREDKADWTIKTKLLTNAELVIIKASILDENGRLVAVGHAEEVRGSTQINKTSALENCETSAIGRALAAYGYGGTEFASADEVAQAISQQKEMDNPLIAYNAAVRDNFQSIAAIKLYIQTGELGLALEAWNELDETREDGTLDQTIKKAIWKAPSAGGCFNTSEREVIKSPEFKNANGEN